MINFSFDKKNNFKNNFYTVFLLCILLNTTSCEDPVPKDYEKNTIVEALLIVNEPIRSIRITQTLPLYEPYSYDDALVKNAKVFIAEDGQNEFELKFKYSENIAKLGYFYDANYLVKKNTKYNLRIILPDNQIVTGTTTTPDAFEWDERPNYYTQYPKDTINLPPNGEIISWTKPTNATFYILTVTCLDTLNYGKYLATPTKELNSKIYKFWLDGSSEERMQRFYRELTVSTLMPNNRTPVVWDVFKWYGLHTVKVFHPDENYRMWYFQILMSGNFNKRFSSVKGCLGFFGSTYMIQDTFFLLKP